MKIEECISGVTAPFRLISMARLPATPVFLILLGFIKNNVTQCSSLAFHLAWLTCTMRECQMHLLGKKNLFEHNVQGFFSNSQLLGSGVVSHS